MWTVLEMILQTILATEIHFNQQHLYGWVYTTSFAGPHSSTSPWQSQKNECSLLEK